MDQKEKDLISHGVVCFGDSDWWYHNRGHMDMQLMKRYARLTKVLYVNSIGVSKLNLKEGTMFLRRLKRKLKSIMRGMKPSGVDNMIVCSPFSMPVHHINIARELNCLALRQQICRCMRKLNMKKPLIWVACPAAANAAVKLPCSSIVYQRSDLYEQFPGVDAGQIKRYDKLLKNRADLVVYVNKGLMAQEKASCKKAIFLDHGVDYEKFALANKNRNVPAEIKKIPHPILGFYGSIDAHTFDPLLVEKLADLLAGVSIVLIGSSSIDLSRLAERKNVYLLGQKPYEQIANYAKCFDVCFMPWQQNRWISACNPIKLKEYLALGKPVVSTPFKELDSYKDLVEVASDANCFAEAVKKACASDSTAKILARRKRVYNDTWDVKAEKVLKVLAGGDVRVKDGESKILVS